MGAPEVPLEQAQEEIAHHAHQATEAWIMGVALTAAFLAALAAVTALLAEHHANEALLTQIRASDQWGFFQAKSIKASVLLTRIEVLKALDKTPSKGDLDKLAEYDADQKTIKEEAEDLQTESKVHLKRHSVLSGAVTMFQLAIAIGAIAVLTKRKPFWYVAIAFGVLGIGFFGAGMWM